MYHPNMQFNNPNQQPQQFYSCQNNRQIPIGVDRDLNQLIHTANNHRHAIQYLINRKNNLTEAYNALFLPEESDIRINIQTRLDSVNAAITSVNNQFQATESAMQRRLEQIQQDEQARQAQGQGHEQFFMNNPMAPRPPRS